ncbi:unnamed protein product [Arctia plantaginis]|uniref:CUB domain-containing protein n=1 Tax=Arctia plantaginis TaxID=874455 RepID=A0A8S1B6K7_ARCPL|nr:unnamed protein product [Arctia plantaginis]
MNVLTPLLLLSRLTSVKLIIVHHTPPDKCDFNATVLPTQKYHFTNDNWPDTYDMGVNCRWTFNCVEGYACRLQCRDVGLPATLGCYMDRLLVSTTSDKTLGARVFCGREPINIRSSGTMITMSKVQFDSHTLQDSGRIYDILTRQ